MARADVNIYSSNSAQYTGGGTNYVIQKHGTPTTFYKVFVDSTIDVMYTKSTDGGFTWCTPIAVSGAISAVSLSVWYNRWSNISDDIVHIAYIESGGADVIYKSLDLATDTLGSPITIFNGTSTASGGALTICSDRGGHIRVVYNIDNGTEDGTASSADAGATWTDTIADATEGATQDQFMLLPGWNADTHDMQLIFVDASANGLSVKRYDDSADTWTETAIIADAGFVDLTAGNAFPNIAAFVDIANSRNVVAGWNAVDAANQDIQVFIVTDTTITETATRAVQNATDDCGLCALALDTGAGTWYAFYCGKSDGSETFSSAMSVYYKTSSDAGATWGSETLLTAQVRGTQYLVTTPRFSTDFVTVFYNDLVSADLLTASVLIPTAGGGGVATPMFGGGVIQ